MFILILYRIINKIKTKIGMSIEREPYFTGNTKKPVSLIFANLIEKGYQWDYFAWEDIGEGLSMRKLYLDRQVHVRVFEDGEVRMHDEWNYEFHPMEHYRGETMQIPHNDRIIEVQEIL